MRVSPGELRVIRAEGLLGRFAVLGPVVFVTVEVPASGSAATALERPTDAAAWGLVFGGEVTLHGPFERRFGPGTAFHVPPGPPPHWFTAHGRAVVAGFAPVRSGMDLSNDALIARGFEPMAATTPGYALPSIVVPAVQGLTVRGPGSIEADVAPMGEWIFMRTMFGPLSGYTSGWCDLAHWGIVASGDLVLRHEDGNVELLSAGDVYSCPAGPPGHQVQVADAAITIDYTPIADVRDHGRMSDWRARAARSHGALGPAPAPAGSVSAR